MRVIYSKVVNSTWPRERVEIFTHTRCAAFAPRTHGLENMPGCSATERSIEEIDGRRAEITEISDNIFFWKKLRRSRANVSHDNEKKMGLFIFKVGGDLAWNSRRVSPAAGPYWKHCYYSSRPHGLWVNSPSDLQPHGLLTHSPSGLEE